MALRVVLLAVGLIDVAATLWACDLERVDDHVVPVLGTSAPTYADYLTQTSFGAWAAVLGTRNASSVGTPQLATGASLEG
jgi:hypothetical protein